jgi:hypothetical protein
MVMAVEQIIAAASQLIGSDRRRLMEALSAVEPVSRHSITELRGLGKEIRRGQDAQEYVSHERDSWAR